MMLGGVPQAVDDLETQRLVRCEELDVSRGQSSAYAGIEANRLLGAPFSDSSPFVQQRSLQQHLERMVQEDQHCITATEVGRLVEVLDAEDKGGDRLIEQEACPFLHSRLRGGGDRY